MTSKSKVGKAAYAAIIFLFIMLFIYGISNTKEYGRSWDEPYAVFIKGTSFLKSKIRAMKREMQRDKETLQDRKQMFGREVRNYLLDEDKINSYRSFFSDSPDTIFREETSDAAKKSEIVINELNSIDKCFVYDDADGIIEIMKKAEENTELSNWNKLRIINECKSALDAL